MSSIHQAPISVKSSTVTHARHAIRAPRGGCTVEGRVYRGGQFCRPFDPANPHGRPAEPTRPAGIALNILGANYSAREIPAGECGTIAYAVEKWSTGARYDVIRNHFGEVTCDCPDFEFRRQGTAAMCKHGNALGPGRNDPIARPAPRPGRRARARVRARVRRSGALYGWASARGIVEAVSRVGRAMGFGGYIKRWSAEEATEVYFAIEAAVVEGGAQ